METVWNWGKARFNLIWLCSILFLYLELSKAQLMFINKFAGTGTASSAGDGGLASSATMYNPYSAYVDTTGNMFITDTSGHKIRKVTAGTNIITTIAGIGSSRLDGDGGAATSAYLYFPRGIWVNSVGVVYISDTDNHRVRTVSTSGIITTFAGMNIRGYSVGSTGDGGQATSATMGSSY